MNDREKIIRALEPVRASGDMVREVLDMADRKKRNTGRKTGRILAAAAAAAVLLIGTALAVGGLGRDRGLMRMLHLTEETIRQAEEAGILESPAASDTHEGITVEAAQCAVDGDSLMAAFRIEGLELGTGEAPSVDHCRVFIGGTEIGSLGWSFDRGMSWDGSRFVYDDGTPADLGASGEPIPRYVRPNGSVELDLSVAPDGTRELGELPGQEIEVRFYDVCGTEGPWVLRWTLSGSAERLTYAPAAVLGDTGATLTEVVLSPISLKLVYAFPMQTFEEIGLNEYGEQIPVRTLKEPPLPGGVVLRDGTELRDITGGGILGYTGNETEVFTVEMNLSRIIDPAEVTALLLHEVGYGDVPASEMTWYTVQLRD